MAKGKTYSTDPTDEAYPAGYFTKPNSLAETHFPQTVAKGRLPIKLNQAERLPHLCVPQSGAIFASDRAFH